MAAERGNGGENVRLVTSQAVLGYQRPRKRGRGVNLNAQHSVQTLITNHSGP